MVSSARSWSTILPHNRSIYIPARQHRAVAFVSYFPSSWSRGWRWPSFPGSSGPFQKRWFQENGYVWESCSSPLWAQTWSHMLWSCVSQMCDIWNWTSLLAASNLAAYLKRIADTQIRKDVDYKLKDANYDIGEKLSCTLHQGKYQILCSWSEIVVKTQLFFSTQNKWLSLIHI